MQEKVLDDIWNIEAWNSLQEAFLVRSTGSKILLTSRNKQVCLLVDARSFLCELQCVNEKKELGITWQDSNILERRYN